MLAGQEASLKARFSPSLLPFTLRIKQNKKTWEKLTPLPSALPIEDTEAGPSTVFSPGDLRGGPRLQSASMWAWTCLEHSCSLGCNLTHDVTVSHLHSSAPAAGPSALRGGLASPSVPGASPLMSPQPEPAALTDGSFSASQISLLGLVSQPRFVLNIVNHPHHFHHLRLL